MSYSVNFYGVIEGGTADDDLKVIEAVDAFVKTLPGVQGGTINSDSHPQVVLQASSGTLGDTVIPEVIQTPDYTGPNRRLATADRRILAGESPSGAERRITARRSDDPAPVVALPDGVDTPLPAATDDDEARELSGFPTDELQAEIARRATAPPA